jgi:hypothetical protein
VLEQRDAAPVELETATQQRDSDAEATEAELLSAIEQWEILKHLENRLKG